MQSSMRSTVCLLVSFLAMSHALADGNARLVIKKSDVLVFLGGTNMLHLQQAGHLEAILTRQFAAQQPRFRDLSWEADTVFRQGTVIERWREKAHFGDDGGLGKLDSQLRQIGASVVIAQFGQLESLAGRRGLDDFVSAYARLVDLFQKQARQVVLVSPTPFETPHSPYVPDQSQRNDDLRLFVAATRKLAQNRNVLFVDLFSTASKGMTRNGMHVEPEAQAFVAREIANQLGIAVKPGTDLELLRQAVVEKHRLWYDYWRPANWKLLFGDDARRQFTRGTVPFREEWKQLVPMIVAAEGRVSAIATGKEDPGNHRPAPEVLHGDSKASIEEELAAFSVPDGMQVNLFASERDGLTSPLNLRWDPAGRMYVTVTTTYPHVFPGDIPNDRVIRLEDTDNDGVADRSTVFAEGLNIPTGIEWGNGGIYVGQNTEILFLKDTNNDGRADERRVLLSGFGNGDSHQTINSFVWSPDGQLYFGHGDGCESRVETPWGASNLFNAGFYRLEPRRLKLVPFLEGHMGPGNPWGVGFDAWGQIFGVDGAGGVSWLSPGQVSTTHRRKFPRIGDPGGYCGIGYLDGRNLPESMRGDFVVGDFKPNRVKRFSLQENGTGFKLEWKEPLLHSRHSNFRPVDVKVGPDGAVYVVDWYNPITCHQDDAYRDPRRDKAHGRIWRVSVKSPAVDTESIRPPDLLQAPLDTILTSLKSPEYWTRYQAKRALTVRDPKAVVDGLDAWVSSLDARNPQYEAHLFQALNAYATIEVVKPSLLNRLLNAADFRARAFAARLVGRWHDRLDDPLSLLADRVTDENPRVRMEAVVSCSAIPSERAIQVGAAVMDRPVDSWIDYAFRQMVRRLQPYWLPAFKRGELVFRKPTHLAAVLNEAGDREAVSSLRKLVDGGDLDKRTRQSAIAAILAVGGPDDLLEYGLNRTRFTQGDTYDRSSHAEALTRLIDVAQSRDTRPSGDVAANLRGLIDDTDPQLQSRGLKLAGLWKIESLQDRVRTAAGNASLGNDVRAAAFFAIASMPLPDARSVLLRHATGPGEPVLRAAAIRFLAEVDLTTAAPVAARHFSHPESLRSGTAEILLAFLKQKEGAQALARTLQQSRLEPDSARHILRTLFSTGRSDKALFDTLNTSLGASAKPPEYSAELVRQLAESAIRKGRADRGATLFKSLACASCHRVAGAGGKVGPNLTALGTTLSTDRIVEELIWPNRQVKEGFSVVQVITTKGQVLTGYERKTRDSGNTGDLVIEDLATRKPVTIRASDIDEKRVAGSPMPTGLTALLDREQLLDLIHYLSDLGKIK